MRATRSAASSPAAAASAWCARAAAPARDASRRFAPPERDDDALAPFAPPPPRPTSHASSSPQRPPPQLGVIPARYASVRFPGKPLVPIAGVPMIVRTWRQARRASTLTRLVVATDDPRIRDACESAGAEVVMTSGDLPNGTERCAAAHEALGGGFDVVVNIQGDEPLIDPSVVDDVVRALQASPDAVYSTVATNLRAEEVTMRSRVKVVVDQLGYAIYFSRSVIPGGKSGEPDASFPYLLHLGLQCYDAEFLRLYPALPATPLQTREDLEQLKVIEHGYRMRVVTTAHAGHGVDEPEDVAKVEAILRDAGEA